jgi:hypothetical protein
MSVLEIPETVEGYLVLQRWLSSLADNGRASEWEDAMRWYCKNDLFFLLNFVLSKGLTINTETGTPLFMHPYYLKGCRDTEYMLANGGGTDASARRSGKSTMRTYAGNIKRIIEYPDSAGCIFSYQRQAAEKHFSMIKQELEQNKLLKTLFSDVLFWDPMSAAKNGETIWSAQKGLKVKRRVIRRELTQEFNSFRHGTPTGDGYDQIDMDDIEDRKSLNTQDLIDDLHATYNSTVNLLTPSVIKVPRLMMTNTFYSMKGIVWRSFDANKKRDPMRARKVPGEDLSTPGPGPLCGTAIYPYTNERLHERYNEMSDKSEYGVQICCDFVVGEDRKFSNGWLVRYREKPEDIGRMMNTIICVDPSRGIEDPTAIWVWGLRSDKRVYWLDALVKKLDPALPEFREAIQAMALKWQNISLRLVDVRVESYGQSTYDILVSQALNAVGIYCPVHRCADTVRTHKFESGKRDREFERWAPNASDGYVHIPLPQSEGGMGIVKSGEGMYPVDLVHSFIHDEWVMFPKPISDHFLDSGSLLWEDEKKIGYPLQYPVIRIKRFVEEESYSHMSAG